MPVALVCSKCAAPEETKHLRKCPICFKYTCDDCCYFFAGRHFCTKGCAEYFFFGTGDEDEDE
jgi:hypothetical protein